MKRPSEEDVADAVDRLHNDSWRTVNKPQLSTGQVEHLLMLWSPVFQSKPRLPSVPKEYKPARSNSKVDKGSQKLGRDFVYGRSGWLCEIQLADICTGRASEWHHRLNKGQGGRWDASNGLHLCAACHDYVTNRGRAEAKAKGWAVAPGKTPPIGVPVLRRGVLVYLDDEGGLEVAVEVA